MEIHIHENNKDSLATIEQNEEKFGKQCLAIYKLLKGGIVLTVRDALLNHGISSLPRRILDLTEKNGIKDIKSEWVLDEKGKRSHKKWFCEIPKPPTKKEITTKFSELLRNGKQAEINF